MLKKTAYSLLILSLLFVSGCNAAQNQPRGNKITLDKAKTEIVYFDAKAEMAVTELTLDFFPAAEVLRDPGGDGKQFVRVSISVTNTSDVEFPLNFTSFQLKDGKGEKVTETFLLNDSNVDDHLESKELKNDEKAEGALYFEVGKDETQQSLLFVYEGYDSEFKDFEVKFE